MIIMHGMDATVLPRLVALTLADRLRAMPALVVTGAHQTGKSTLVQQLTPGTRRYRSLDDLDVLDAARRDPEALVGGDDPVTLDEIQRAPELLHAVKRAIDRRRSRDVREAPYAATRGHAAGARGSVRPGQGQAVAMVRFSRQEPPGDAGPGCRGARSTLVPRDAAQPGIETAGACMTAFAETASA